MQAYAGSPHLQICSPGSNPITNSIKMSMGLFIICFWICGQARGVNFNYTFIAMMVVILPMKHKTPSLKGKKIPTISYCLNICRTRWQKTGFYINKLLLRRLDLLLGNSWRAAACARSASACFWSASACNCCGVLVSPKVPQIARSADRHSNIPIIQFFIWHLPARTLTPAQRDRAIGVYNDS